jgi:hypothetical protein
MPDRSEQDVTLAATWRSDNSTVATVSRTGLVTSVGFGQANIVATLLPARSLSLAIFVLPEGTYILSGGGVQDPDGKPVADARMEIMGGPMSGRATMTDQGGNWQFIGVSGVMQVSASKEGYVPAVILNVPQDGAGRDPIISVCGTVVLAPVGAGSSRVVPCNI